MGNFLIQGSEGRSAGIGDVNVQMGIDVGVEGREQDVVR